MWPLNHLRVRWQTLQISLYRHCLTALPTSKFAWRVLDEAGIKGFGTHLLRFDFPPKLDGAPAWGHDAPAHPELEHWLDRFAEDCEEQTKLALSFSSELTDLPLYPREDAPLAWRNIFQTPLDILLDYGVLRSKPPHCYVEVGSGVSTHVADFARQRGSGFEIISIDPEPRAEIGQIADRLLKCTLEESVGFILDHSGPGTVLFIDGSHFAFPSSDVTMFFLELLPRLPGGTRVHLHDIYLPDDYPQRHLRRLWNEQYVLAAWILGGANRIRLVIPGHWVSRKVQSAGLHAWSSELPADCIRALSEEKSSSCWWMDIE